MLGSSIACLPIEPDSESDTASAWVEVEHARATGERSGLAVEGTCVLRRPNCPENVGSRLVSLLQSAPDQTLSAIFGTAKKPNCRRHSRVRLGGSRAERYAKSLSERRILSEAWGLADLLYKLFSVTFQCIGLVRSRKVGIPFACCSLDREPPIR